MSREEGGGQPDTHRRGTACYWSPLNTKGEAHFKGLIHIFIAFAQPPLVIGATTSPVPKGTAGTPGVFTLG